MHALMSSSGGSAPDSVSCAHVVVRGEPAPEAAREEKHNKRTVDNDRV
jgi:hypothetical protein